MDAKAAPALFDAAHFDMMTGGDRTLQAEIAALFRAREAEWRVLFAPAHPGESWRDGAHTLKGSARGIGLWALAEACAAAEAAAAEAPALEALNRALDAALGALDAY
ncbi:MAG: Hpt domain-containing protein [Hyphomonadaceae bacterium]